MAVKRGEKRPWTLSEDFDQIKFNLFLNTVALSKRDLFKLHAANLFKPWGTWLQANLAGANYESERTISPSLH